MNEDVLMLDEEGWNKDFKPEYNRLNSSASWEGTLFEPNGAEMNHVLSQKLTAIWTLVRGPEGLYIANGVHKDNRVGFFITKKPWQLDVIYEVEIDE